MTPDIVIDMLFKTLSWIMLVNNEIRIFPAHIDYLGNVHSYK